MKFRPLIVLTIGISLASGACIYLLHPYRSALPEGVKVDRLIVYKEKRAMAAYANGERIREYRISLGKEPTGAKEREGDRRTPEGRYVIDYHNPNSAYRRSLHISYPTAAERAKAKSGGYAPGGDVMIHGLRNDLGWIGRAHLLSDWTNGCIAVTNDEMDELFRIVPDGTPIEIQP